jgi:hypothetical protein
LRHNCLSTSFTAKSSDLTKLRPARKYGKPRA